VSVNESDRHFTFIVESHHHHCPRLLAEFISPRVSKLRREGPTDVGTLPVSHETELYEGAREGSLLILLMKRFSANLNHQLARVLVSAKILV
jgi:hypothetical protein